MVQTAAGNEGSRKEVRHTCPGLTFSDSVPEGQEAENSLSVAFRTFIQFVVFVVQLHCGLNIFSSNRIQVCLSPKEAVLGLPTVYNTFSVLTIYYRMGKGTKHFQPSLLCEEDVQTGSF